jgi:hypothetical protein
MGNGPPTFGPKSQQNARAIAHKGFAGARHSNAAHAFKRKNPDIARLSGRLFSSRQKENRSVVLSAAKDLRVQQHGVEALDPSLRSG